LRPPPNNFPELPSWCYGVAIRSRYLFSCKVAILARGDTWNVPPRVTPFRIPGVGLRCTWPFAPRTSAFSRSEKPRICQSCSIKTPHGVTPRSDRRKMRPPDDQEVPARRDWDGARAEGKKQLGAWKPLPRARLDRPERTDQLPTTSDRRNQRRRRPATAHVITASGRLASDRRAAPRGPVRRGRCLQVPVQAPSIRKTNC
jgi:hypothetical protein